MKDRCYLPSGEGWKYYGGRGIKVCERWRGDFAAFLADMGRRPSPRHSIDRINNDGDYEPGNCRWATPSEQRRNQRLKVLVERDGVLVPLLTVCEQLGLNRANVAGRLKIGWSLADALMVPIRPYQKRFKF